MTPQEKLAALLYTEATDEPWTVAGVEHDIPDRDYYRELAGKIITLLSEHGGGGEAEPVAWVPAAMLDKRVGQNFYTASRFQIDAGVPLYLHPPTPSATDRVNCVEAMADAAHNLYVAIEAGATCVNSLHADLGKQLRAFHGSGPATGGGKEPDEDDDSDRDPCPGCFYRSCNGECMEVD